MRKLTLTGRLYLLLLALLLSGCNLSQAEEEPNLLSTAVAQTLTAAPALPTPAAATSTPEVTSPPTHTPPSPEESPDFEQWQTYTHPVFSYQVQYPPDAEIMGANQDHALQFVGPVSDGEHWPWFFIEHFPSDFYHPPEDVDLQEWVQGAGLGFESVGEPRYIGGQEAVHFVDDPSPQAYGGDHYYFLRAGQLYHILILHTMDRQDWAIYDFFLDSFEFVGPPPTATPTPTPVGATQDPDLPSGDPDWVDDFQTGANWGVYQNQDVRFEIKDGALVMTDFKADFIDWWLLSWPQLTDFYLEATFTTGDTCNERDRYGLMTRSVQPEDIYLGYQFVVSCNGQYTLRDWDGEGNFTILIPWTANPLITKGPNVTQRLGFWVDGTQIKLFVNGNRLADITDDTYGSGRFGVVVGSGATVNFNVQVERIAYWTLP